MWVNQPVQRKRKLSDWSPPAEVPPLASAAQHAWPIVPCSVDELVPSKNKNNDALQVERDAHKSFFSICDHFLITVDLQICVLLMGKIATVSNKMSVKFNILIEE